MGGGGGGMVHTKNKMHSTEKMMEFVMGKQLSSYML